MLTMRLRPPRPRPPLRCQTSRLHPEQTTSPRRPVLGAAWRAVGACGAGGRSSEGACGDGRQEREDGHGAGARAAVRVGERRRGGARPAVRARQQGPEKGVHTSSKYAGPPSHPRAPQPAAHRPRRIGTDKTQRRDETQRNPRTRTGSARRRQHAAPHTPTTLTLAARLPAPAGARAADRRRPRAA